MTKRARPSARTPARRGSALMLTMVALLIMSIAGLSLSANSVQALRLTRIQKESSVAFNLAESGAEAAAHWLRRQGAPPSELRPFNPFRGAVALGDGYYTVTIDGADDNPERELKRYAIAATGVSGNRTETISTFLQAATFGRYAYFTDYETSSLTSSAIWFKAGEVVDGPAHSNNTSGSLFHINYVNSKAPIFHAPLTAAAAGIIYNPGEPYGEAEYLKVFAAGSRGFRLGVNRIELPESTERQRVAAWGESLGFPTLPGVHLNLVGSVPVGGIYVYGDADIAFQTSGATTQVLQIKTGGKTVHLTIDRAANVTRVIDAATAATDLGAVTELAGVPNGVIYVTGNVTGLRGTIADSVVADGKIISRNAWTLAVDLGAGKDVRIDGDVTYLTAPDKTKPWNDPVNLKAGAFGIVARNIILDRDAPTNLRLHGVMLAGGRNTTDGSFYNEGWSTKSPGTLSLLGGIIQKRRGPVGTFSSSTGAQKTGFQKNYVYDPRMAVHPPPFFPTTGLYDRLSWTRSAGGPRVRKSLGNVLGE